MITSKAISNVTNITMENRNAVISDFHNAMCPMKYMKPAMST